MSLLLYISFLNCYSLFNKYRKEFFKEAGEIVDVRLATNEDGGLRGFGHVEFANPEAAQKVFILFGILFTNLVNIPLLSSELSS